MLSIEQARKLETKEELLAELNEHIRVRNQMGGALYWGILNDECAEIATKCVELGTDRQKIEEILIRGR